MRLGVKFLGNNNRSDILLLGVVNDLCKKKKKSTYKMFIKAYRHQSFELLLLITVSKCQCSLLAVFNSPSKVIRVGFGFALIFPMIGSENSRHPLDQSNAKRKPVSTGSLAFFPRFIGSLPYFPLL